jgi:hypothetical protein
MVWKSIRCTAANGAKPRRTARQNGRPEQIAAKEDLLSDPRLCEEAGKEPEPARVKLDRHVAHQSE